MLDRTSQIIEGRVDRVVFSERSTISQVTLPGLRTLWGLEDRIRGRGLKIRGQTAISPGRYRVVLDYSQRFRRELPHVLEVPVFAGIRWHAGNTHLDTEGCLLLGLASGPDRVTHSRDAVELVVDWFRRHSRHQIWVTYANANPPKELLEDV